MVTTEIHLWTYTSTWVDDSNVQEPVGFSTFSFIKLATAVSERTVSITQNFTRVSVNYKEMFRPVNYQLFNRWLAHFSFGNLENSPNLFLTFEPPKSLTHSSLWWIHRFQTERGRCFVEFLSVVFELCSLGWRKHSVVAPAHCCW